MENKFGKIELNTLIEERIIDLELKKAKQEIKQEDIDKETARYIDAFGGEEEFKTAIASQGMTQSDFEKGLKRTRAIALLLGDDVKVTEEEIEKVYSENLEQFYKKATAETHVILVEEESTAKDIISQLADGGDFAELAKLHSSHASAEEGGFVGDITEDVLSDELAKATFSLAIDEISEPVKTEAGYHVIKVTNKVEAAQGTLEESKAEIETALISEKTQAKFGPWYSEKIKEYKVKNNLIK